MVKMTNRRMFVKFCGFVGALVVLPGIGAIKPEDPHPVAEVVSSRSNPRLIKIGDRRIFYVDAGNLTPVEVENFVDRFKRHTI
jgi:hypothetical protein